MKSDDLSTLFQPQAQDVGFHSGKIITWNDSNGLNSVEIAGAVIQNLPMLNLGDVIALRPGDVVGVLRFMNTYFILGRIIAAGSGQFASTAVSVAGLAGAAQNFGLSTTEATLVTNNITVPTWADEAQILVVSNATIANSSANEDYFTLRTAINSINGTQTITQIPAGKWESWGSSATRFITSPGSTITVESKMRMVNFSLAADANNTVGHDGIVVFRSTV